MHARRSGCMLGRMDTYPETTVRELAIGEVPLDDVDALADWVEVRNAAESADAPWTHPETVASAGGYLRYGWDLESPVPFVGRVDGVPVVAGSYATSEYDNTHLAWLGVRVHPGHRRRGHGSAMLTFLLDHARTHQKTSAGMDAWEGDGPAAFAARHGFTPRLVSVNRRQFLAELDWSALDAAYDAARPRAADYEFVRVQGRSPDEALAEMAELTAAINDAPLDDLDFEDEVFSPERIRNYETAQEGRRIRIYRVVARHRGTGELAGHTIVGAETDRPGIADQHDTAVARSHRGHRLGLLLKIEMLRWLREAEPELRTIDTWNAGSNDHMISVNEILGYRVMGREVAYQRSLAE